MKMTADSQPKYDSFLLVSFGGPEGREDVIPFLENVLRGKNVPRARMLEVAEHYYHFEGVSPINDQNRALLAALEAEFRSAGIDLPLYWGNRNWHPMLKDTLDEMWKAGHRHALAFFTSIFSSYSGCRQYRENIAQARQALEGRAPRVDKLRNAFNHPLFIEAVADRIVEATASHWGQADTATVVLFTAHSIPIAMAQHSPYVAQLQESASLVAERLNIERWEVVYQSRSGPPAQPWLEPDVVERARELAERGARRLVVVPLGFVSDHIEVLFDLDTELKQECDRLGVEMVRVPTVGTHPSFVRMIRMLVQERLDPSQQRPAIGRLPPTPDECPADCCLYPRPGIVSHSVEP